MSTEASPSTPATPSSPEQPEPAGQAGVAAGAQAVLDPAQAAADGEHTHTTVGTYSTYPEAQNAVDLLSDKGFPVENVQIVGHGLRLVEVVTGRMTSAKAALYGALTGAWFGLFVGALFALFRGSDETGVLWLLAVPVVIGAVWGALFGFIGHLGTRGQRDFTSLQQFVASRYEVSVVHSLSMRARQILAAGR
jgi:hypothetical protein